MALRWKKNPMPTGLARVGCGPQGSALRDGDRHYASAYPLRRHHQTVGWYWVAGYGSSIPHKNTCNEPVPDETTAKAEAMVYVRECLKAPAAAQAANKE
jgi:hypothetical protein